MLPPNRNSLPDPASFFRESCAEGEAEAAPPRRATKASFNFHRESEQLRSKPTGRRRRGGWGGDRAPTLFEVTFHMKFIGGNNSPTVFVCTSKIVMINICPMPNNFRIEMLVGPRKAKMGIQRGAISVAPSAWRSEDGCQEMYTFWRVILLQKKTEMMRMFFLFIWFF